MMLMALFREIKLELAEPSERLKRSRTLENCDLPAVRGRGEMSFERIC